MKKLLSISMVTLATFSGTAFAANIAIIKGNFYSSDLKNQLIAAGDSVTELVSYNATTLSSYDSVIHYGNSFTNTASLESYVQSGGVLILTPWAGQNFSIPSNLAVFNEINGGTQYSTLNPGFSVTSPSDSLLSGVSLPGSGGFSVGRTSNITFANGATAVASWADGVSFLGYKSYGAGVSIGINMQVITSDTPYNVIDQQWAANLFHNAANINVTAAVPEPETYALFAAGLGLMGWSRRRSARRAIRA